MKRFLSVFLCVCIVMTTLVSGVMTVFAEGNKLGSTDIIWSFNTETKELMFEGEGAIPDFDNYSEADAIPWGDVEFTSIIFGEGITGIGNYAFYSCESLKTVEIPDTVTALGKGVFYKCTALESVKLPADVTEIGDSMFSVCLALKSVTIGEKTEAIGTKAFYRCSALESITIPASVKAIGASAFELCSMLNDITLSEGLVTISDRAFYCCEALATITLPSSLEVLGTSAFNECYNLKEIAIPEKITVIPAEAFYNCTALENVTLPEGLVSIGEKAFYLCKKLLEVEVPASVTTFGTMSLGYGSKSKPIDGFTIKGFSNTNARLYADANGFNFDSLGYVTSGQCGETATWVYDEETKTLYINGSGAIADYTKDNTAKYNLIDFEKVVISDEITKIGAYAFYGAPAVEFNLSLDVTEIGEKAIGYYADNNKDVLREETVITAYERSAAEAYAKANKITFNSLGKLLATEGKCGENISWAYDTETKALTITGSGAMYDYTADTAPDYVYHDVASIAISEEITKIGAYAFYGMAAVEFNLSLNTTDIGEKAIGYYVAENGTEALREGTIITAYERSAAEAYAKANNITFNSLGILLDIEGQCGENIRWNYDAETKTLTLIGSGAMYDYTADTVPDYVYHDVTSVVINKRITRIGAYAFYGMPALTFTLAPAIAEIGEKAIGYYVDENGAEALREGTVISGYEQTAAHAYATANNITFDSQGVYVAVEGDLGENVTWSYNQETKVLTVTGTGAMYNYKADALPEYAEYEISEIIVSDGITSIGDYAFATTTAYPTITIGKDVMSIGVNAFGFTKTVLRDENGNPTDEVVFMANEELVVKGYIVTPADEYAREFMFIFEALDGDTYFEFSFNIPSVTDHINKFIYVYPANNATEITVNPADEAVTVAKPDKFKTTAAITFTKGDKTADYTIVVVGDATNDGVVNSTDALRVLLHTVDSKPIEDAAVLEAGDIDNNGKVDSTDALAILQIAVDKKKVTDFYNPGKLG